MRPRPKPVGAWPSINARFGTLPPQMQAEGVLLLAEAGRGPDAICRATGMWPGEARDRLRLGMPFRAAERDAGAAE